MLMSNMESVLRVPVGRRLDQNTISIAAAKPGWQSALQQQIEAIGRPRVLVVSKIMSLATSNIFSALDTKKKKKSSKTSKDPGEKKKKAAPKPDRFASRCVDDRRLLRVTRSCEKRDERFALRVIRAQLQFSPYQGCLFLLLLLGRQNKDLKRLVQVL